MRSSNPRVLIWSWSRLSLLMCLTSGITYLAISPFKTSLLRVNNYVLYLLCFIGVCLEGFFRLFPQFVPEGMRGSIPQEAIEEIARSRGQLMPGKGMVYHYSPNTILERYPHVVVDSMGYRNAHLKAGPIDVVLLGDSFLLALDSTRDLGELLLDEGYVALNLGMGGYGPQHYHDVYKILDRETHRSSVCPGLSILR